MNATDDIFRRFMANAHPKLMELAAASDGKLALQAEPADPPAAYIAHFHCRGYVRDTRTGVITTNDHWIIGVRFPDDYLRAVRPAELITVLHPFGAIEAWHPNLHGNFLCGNIKPGMQPVDVFWQIYEVITGNKFQTADCLNRDAAEWLRNNPSAFPADRRPLVGGTPSQSETPAP